MKIFKRKYFVKNSIVVSKECIFFLNLNRHSTTYLTSLDDLLTRVVDLPVTKRRLIEFRTRIVVWMNNERSMGVRHIEKYRLKIDRLASFRTITDASTQTTFTDQTGDATATATAASSSDINVSSSSASVIPLLRRLNAKKDFLSQREYEVLKEIDDLLSVDIFNTTIGDLLQSSLLTDLPKERVNDWEKRLSHQEE